MTEKEEAYTMLAHLIILLYENGQVNAADKTSAVNALNVLYPEGWIRP